MQIYDRQLKIYEEEIEYEKEKLEFLYNTVLGRILLKTFVARPIFSKFRARYYKSSKSVKDIVPFIEKHGVDVSEWNVEDFKSFNDFFTRKKAINIDSNPEELLSIADARLSVYRIDDDTKLNIKNSVYSVSAIVKDEEIAKDFSGGFALVFRLAADDYHRHSFVDDGEIVTTYRIKGMLHTVRSLAEKYKVYSANSREVTVYDTHNFGRVVQIDVGALLIGAMVNTYTDKSTKKMLEKGYFEYGGSTIVLLVGPNCSIDEDIMNQSAQGFECKVRIGDKIGIVNKPKEN